VATAITTDRLRTCGADAESTPRQVVIESRGWPANKPSVMKRTMAQATAFLLLAALFGVLFGCACAWLDGFYNGCLQYVLSRYLA
jgi:hypothetical protein